jgi:voltage-gated potassium channel
MSDHQLKNLSRIGPIQIAILVLTITLLAALLADTLLVLPTEISRLIHVFDTAVCIVLLADFFARLYRAESKLAFLRWGWIDLVASIPNLGILRWGRLFRVLRVIRLLRGLRSVHRVFAAIFHDGIESGLVSVLLTSFLLISITSISVLLCERGPDANIKTAEDALWWSVSTIATVGCPDRYPVSSEGRVLGMALMIAGVGAFGGLSGLAASFFLGIKARDASHHRDTEAILARIEVLNGKLEAVRGAQREEG